MFGFFVLLLLSLFYFTFEQISQLNKKESP